MRNSLATGQFECAQHFKHAISATGPEIEFDALRWQHLFYRFYMPDCQVDDVYVVTHPCAVRSRIVVAPNIQFLTEPDRDLRNIWHQIIWRIFWIFADQPAFVGSDRIEIAQNGDIPIRISSEVVAKHVFSDQFGTTIRIRCRQRMRLVYGQRLRFAIDRGGRAENQLLHADGLHRIQQCESAHYIVMVIRQRISDGFADSFQSCKMNH
ncbi:hypothetical protein BIZ92_01490 [Achromobacter xylosoxidans]|uniref:Uncharacterized protein n=1 Tax=Alcaligenes xylosoxydans xylosoxydans TaxID=85698 RepID=A0A1R1K0S5_ALCXX|nr:hypothetical protein BIZ92_01490 [Achromobacter xylosoxidans]